MLKGMQNTKSSFGCYRGGQFRHSRLKEGGNNLEVSNPMYMAQATEDDEDDSRQPLDQPYDFDPEKVSTYGPCMPC